MRDRVKFFSIYDIPIGFYLEPVKEKLDNFDDNIEYNDINDIIEFSNIEKFIDNNIFHKDWTEEEIKKYKNINFKKVIGKSLKKIDDSNIVSIISKIDTIYLEDFWELFSKYVIYKRISKDKFKTILNLKNFYINYILHYEKIVFYYDDIIKDYFILNNDKSVELYINEYFEEKEKNKKPLYFPPSLTKEEKEKQLELYVTADFKKLNYFKTILKSFSSNELNLSPLLKRNVKKIYDELLNSYFKNNDNKMSYGYSLIFEKGQKETVKIIQKDTNNIYELKIKFSLDWVTNNLDYPTILNNFIYVFELVDDFFIFSNLSYEEELGLFEKLSSVGINEYKTGISFDFKKSISENTLIKYYEILKENNIRLEEVLEWFFKEYLVKEFGIKNFSINLPSENLTYLEKCKCIFNEIERVLKEFTLYKDYNEIDTSILELLTNQIDFKEIKSLLEKKYVYINPNNKIIQSILYFLFSNQSDLIFGEYNLNKYDTFLEIIEKEKISISILSPNQLKIIEFLISENIVQKEKNGILNFNFKLIYILNILYKKEVVCPYHLKNMEKELKYLENKNMIYYENTLFSKKESDYLDYYLKSKFSNGFELRNKYAHGTYPADEKEHFRDYFKFLEILILIIIKINDEFCLYDKILKNKNNYNNYNF